jgi:hypothetical protein
VSCLRAGFAGFHHAYDTRYISHLRFRPIFPNGRGSGVAASNVNIQVCIAGHNFGEFVENQDVLAVVTPQGRFPIRIFLLALCFAGGKCSSVDRTGHPYEAQPRRTLPSRLVSASRQKGYRYQKATLLNGSYLRCRTD